MKRRSVLCLGWVLALAACDHGPAFPGAPGEDPEGGTLGFVVSAQQGSCPGGAVNPFDDLARVLIQVTERDDDFAVVASKEFAVGSGTTAVSLMVPVGNDYTVTLQGFGRYDGTTPSWYARRRDVDVQQGSDNPPLEMVLARYKGFTCITPHVNLTERMFPAVVDLGDGRVLIAGGFTQATPTGAGSDKVVLDGASKLAFVYDTRKGTLAQTATAMNDGRAAAGGVFVPLEDGKALIFGGASKMTVQVRGDFEMFVDPADALATYEVFDTKTLSFEAVPEGQERKMTMARVWPATLLLGENSVLVAGSGAWPGSTGGTTGDPRRADLWLPATGITDRGAASDQMNAEHFAPAIAPLDDVDGRVRAVFFGGTTDGAAVFEVYTEPSSKEVAGSFVPLGKGSIAKLPFLASLSPLTEVGAAGDVRFLAAGGVVKDGTRYVAGATAYVVTVSRGDNVVSLAETKAVETPCAKRFFHAAADTERPGRVTLLGGFTAAAQDPGGMTCFFDVARYDAALTAGSPLDGAFWQPSAGEEVFADRAGHGAVRLDDDTVLLVGGMETTAGALNGDRGALLEVYAPPTVQFAP